MVRAQVSMEYMVLIGVAIGILIPGVLFFYSYAQSGSGSSANARINEIGLDVISGVKSTYALGAGAKNTLEFTLPDPVTRVYVSGAELTVSYDTRNGRSDAVFFSSVPMNATNPDGSINLDGNVSYHPGETRYRLISHGSWVEINEVT